MLHTSLSPGSRTHFLAPIYVFFTFFRSPAAGRTTISPPSRY